MDAAPIPDDTKKTTPTLISIEPIHDNNEYERAL